MNNVINKILQNNPVLCAPLCGYTDFAFREILSLYRPAIVFTEMLSTEGLKHNLKKTLGLYRESTSDVPLGIQLFGNNPESFKKAASVINPLRFDVIDVNSGCSVKKILKSHSGCALMESPDLIYRIISAVKSETDKPVTIKMRLGMEKHTFIDCALAAEEAGAEWVTLHARTKKQMFSGPVSFEAISTLKKALKIPVIGNGEIWSAEDAALMLNTTGCDAVMLARGLVGKPWLVKQCIDYVKTGSYTEPPRDEMVRIMQKHLQLMVQDRGVEYGIKEFRKHVVKYAKGFENSRTFRSHAVTITEPDIMHNHIQRLLIQEEMAV